MDIKRAKQEIEHAVKAYLAVDDTGTPLIPPLRQRPILLMGPPGGRGDGRLLPGNAQL